MCNTTVCCIKYLSNFRDILCSLNGMVANPSYIMHLTVILSYISW